MTRISVELQGEKEFRRALAQAAQDVKNQTEAVVVATAIEMRADIVKSVERGPASGRTYTHYFYTTKNGKLAQGRKRAKPHTASAPGQPPMSDTGRLANNIYFERLGDLTAAVGSTLAYAYYLEYGTERMAARPFFRPVVERMRPKFIDKLEVAISGGLK